MVPYTPDADDAEWPDWTTLPELADFRNYPTDVAGRLTAKYFGVKVVNQILRCMAEIQSVTVETGGIGFFGDGADGALTYDGSTTILGMVPSGSVYTLTRDIYPSSMTVNTGVTIKNRGFRIICKGTLTLTGTAKIHDNGNNGTNTGTKGSALAAAGMLQASSAQGGNDQVAGSSITSSLGGAGGAGGGGSGGAGGTVTAPSTNNGGTNLLRSLPFTLWIDTMIFALTLKGGAGGGGGTDGTNVGGGGGGGGGAVVVAAKTITGAGFIQAIGGNGGAGNTTNDSGGGGGGGGFVCIVTRSVAGVTISAAGGTGGASGGGAGVAGSNGSAGRVYEVIS